MNNELDIIVRNPSLAMLRSLRHSPKTNIAKGRISNHDAALIIMAESQDGASQTGEVIAALRSWRGPHRSGVHLAFRYLFNTSSMGGYGFVGKNIESVFSHVWRAIPQRDGRRRTYWYRTMKGHYRITIEGYRRIGELAQNK
jgi:hypothetical protein